MVGTTTTNRSGKKMNAKSIKRDDPRVSTVPEVIVNQKMGKRYTKGKFLGKGGFAKCYELTDMETHEVHAGKVVPKAQLVKQSQKDKMTQEISIHGSLSNRHVVGFHGYFEDSENIYILLELCSRRSLMELHKRRKYVTEMEARYFIRQIVQGCVYLHENKVIHRDLKLGNLFLNDDLEVKIGDFGLATRIDYDGERKKTLCGTPNYIAPEVLSKKGHSYEVDVWSLGCIVYTLLVGRPPFETSSLRDTYSKIRRNEYQIPNHLTKAAGLFIRELLRGDPCQRPTMTYIASHPFFSGFIPRALPVSCLTTAPRLDILNGEESVVKRRPLGEVNTAGDIATRFGNGEPEAGTIGNVGETEMNTPRDAWISELFKQVNNLFNNSKIKCIECEGFNGMEDAEDPVSSPIFWVSKWVDYSDKYGLGYQLCDNSYGVLFNDTTKLLLTSNEQNLQYIEKDGTEHLHTVKKHPDWLQKKVTLLHYFKTYMTEHLLKAGGNMQPREVDEMVRLPFLRIWFRTRSAIVLHLSNGTLQLNFFDDHTKIILCPLMGAVTVITAEREFKTFRLASFEKYGLCKDLLSRLHYAQSMMNRIISSQSGSARVKLSVQ